jgi:hypothetical protein
LNEARIVELAQSMKEIGLIQPIIVRQETVGFGIIAGNHRYEAAHRLKWKAVPCLIVDCPNDNEARLMEIDENLVRAELGVAERAQHVTERKKVYETLHPETKKGASQGNGMRARGKPQCQVGTKASAFIDDTAAKTGRSRRDIARDAQRGAKIPRIEEVVGTSLDTGRALDELAKRPPPEQDTIIDAAKRGEALQELLATSSFSQIAEGERETLAKRPAQEPDAIIDAAKRAAQASYLFSKSRLSPAAYKEVRKLEKDLRANLETEFARCLRSEVDRQVRKALAEHNHDDRANVQPVQEEDIVIKVFRLYQRLSSEQRVELRARLEELRHVSSSRDGRRRRRTSAVSRSKPERRGDGRRER